MNRDDFAPPWAEETGQDAFGHWAAFRCGKVRQVMRWIEPGSFLSGSPEDDPELLIVTKGFWRGETTCNQELWDEVMGTNLSCSADPQRPVENVSRSDIQEFLKRLQQMLPIDVAVAVIKESNDF